MRGVTTSTRSGFFDNTLTRFSYLLGTFKSIVEKPDRGRLAKASLHALAQVDVRYLICASFLFPAALMTL